MLTDRDFLPKGSNGEPLKVFGEMDVEEYRQAMAGRYKRIEVLGVSPEAEAALRSIPGGRLELHPRVTVPGMVDLVPTAYDPALRTPVFKRQDQRRGGF